MASPFSGMGDPEIHGTTRTTLAAAGTLLDSSDPVQIIDCGGAARDVTLPAERAGKMFIISNISDAAEAITLKNDAGTALATISQYQTAWCFSDGTGWTTVLGAAATVQT